jgi:hypothetical protein
MNTAHLNVTRECWDKFAKEMLSPRDPREPEAISVDRIPDRFRMWVAVTGGIVRGLNE